LYLEKNDAYANVFLELCWLVLHMDLIGLFIRDSSSLLYIQMIRCVFWSSAHLLLTHMPGAGTTKDEY